MITLWVTDRCSTSARRKEGTARFSTDAFTKYRPPSISTPYAWHPESCWKKRAKI